MSYGLSEEGSLIMWGYVILVSAPIVVWLANTLSIRIEVNDRGIALQSLLRNLSIEWCDVESIEWDFMFSGHKPQLQKQKPGDMRIISNDKKIHVFPFLMQEGDLKAGIVELEAIIKNRIPSIYEVSVKRNQVKHRSRLSKEHKLGIVAGLLMALLGGFMFVSPLRQSQETFGFISKFIGVSADALFLMGGGMFFVLYGLFKLKK